MARWITNRWRRCWRPACRGALVTLMGAVLSEGSWAFAFSAEGENSISSPSVVPTVVALEYTETPYGVNDKNLGLKERSQPFGREPASTGKVIRGTLQFGGTNNIYAFLWQYDEGRLTLDLNQNQDLTDDPAGNLSRLAAGARYYQTFTNIHFNLRSPSGICRVKTDLHFWYYGTGSAPGCSAELHSFWQGKATLAGTGWQVGLVPNFSWSTAGGDGDALLLRPWSERAEAFSGNNLTFDTTPFTRKVFFGGHAYELRWRAGAGTVQMTPALEMREQAVTLGEVRLTGRYIKRMLLSGEYLAVLDHPPASVQVPVGNYRLAGIFLEKDGAQAHPAGGLLGKNLTVTARNPVVLAAGGPLTNSVTTTRRGNILTLDYRIIGDGGQMYQLAAVDRAHPPAFAIYKGQRNIASGSFEFG